MKNYPLIKPIINILSNNSTRFFESYIKDFKLNLNNFLPVGAPAINCSFKCDVCGGDTPKTFFRNACKSWIKNHCTSKNNVCNKCPKGIAPIDTRQIQAIGNNKIKCSSESLYPGGTTPKDCHIRLYEVVSEMRGTAFQADIS